MRAIEFRGLRKDGKGWVYGWYAEYDREPRIYEFDNPAFPVEVVPETVGQYTGLRDNNGAKIFEGDILTDGILKEKVGYLCGTFRTSSWRSSDFILKELVDNFNHIKSEKQK